MTVDHNFVDLSFFYHAVEKRKKLNYSLCDSKKKVFAWDRRLKIDVFLLWIIGTFLSHINFSGVCAYFCRIFLYRSINNSVEESPVIQWTFFESRQCEKEEEEERERCVRTSESNTEQCTAVAENYYFLIWMLYQVIFLVSSSKVTFSFALLFLLISWTSGNH